MPMYHNLAYRLAGSSKKLHHMVDMWMAVYLTQNISTLCVTTTPKSLVRTPLRWLLMLRRSHSCHLSRTTESVYVIAIVTMVCFQMT